jgi:tRNA threonylcarbamoyladenosine biosynthesis protein TsaB
VVLLALDSATTGCSVAICDDAGGMLAYRNHAPGAAQADRLVALIDAAVDTADIDYGDLELIAVNRGPGSFTGVRAGVAAARGLALALARPVLAVTTLEVLAAEVGAQPAGTILAAMDARRGQVYVQAFDHRLTPLDRPGARAPEHVPLRTARRPLHLVGSGAEHLRTLVDDAVTHAASEVDARAVARQALGRLARGDSPQRGPQVQPLYLRAPDARLPATPARAGATIGT